MRLGNELVTMEPNAGRTNTTMNALSRILLVAAVLFLGASAYAQDAPRDAEGCKDSPLVTRFPGSHINSSRTKSSSKPIFHWATTKKETRERNTWKANITIGTSARAAGSARSRSIVIF